MKLTLNQKRFLIIWILFHSFALFVNLASIRGEVDDDSVSHPTYKSNIILFNNPIPEHESDFWPFTSYSETSWGTATDTVTYPGGAKIAFQGFPTKYYYGGLFNSYGLPEYIFYMCLGFAIIYLPKLWK